MNAERQQLRDYIKGIGIALVVYGHVARGVVKAGLPFDQQLFELFDTAIYSFHMPLFFVVSGVLFLGSFARKGRLEFAVGKLQTIAYPYLIWSILQGLFEVVLSRWTNGGVTLSEVFSLLWRPRAQFWFLYILLFVFLISSLAYSVRKEARNRVVLVVAVALYLFGWSPIDLYAFNMFGQWFVYFALGVAFAKLVPWFGMRFWCFPLFAFLFWGVFNVSPEFHVGSGLKLLLALLGVGGGDCCLRLGYAL